MGCWRVRRRKVSCKLWAAAVCARVAVGSQWCCWECHWLCGRRSMLGTAQPSLRSPFSQSLEAWGCATSPELSVVGNRGESMGRG